MTRKNQFELVTASFNDKEKPVRTSFNNLKNLFVCVSTTASFNNQSQPDWVSFNNQEEPVLS